MKDNFILPLSLAATVLFVILIFFIVFFVLIHQRNKHRLKNEKNRAIFEEQERTMSQVSKEVHDNLGGFLNLAMMNIEVVKGLPLNPKQKEAINNAGNIITQLIVEVQNISHVMNSNYIMSRGLFDILNSQMKYISSTKNMKCDIDIIGEDELLGADEQLVVYRIAQEAIQNALKHSGATKLSISLAYTAPQFTMQISDNGSGFDTQSLSSAHGIGLMNMQERAHLLGGSLEIHSEPGRGCTIKLVKGN